jgi:hypothetical protein
MNPFKSEALALASSSVSWYQLTVDIAGTPVCLSDKFEVIGVTVDNHLTLDDHVASPSQISSSHMRSITYMRTSLPTDMN